MTTQKNKNDVLYFTIFFSVILSNHSTQFSLVSYYVIIQIIYNPWIFSLISKWGMIPVVDFGFWKSCIYTYQRKKSIFLMAKESDPSCCLESVDHQMQVNYTNGTLEVSHIPTDLAQISMCITCSVDLICISICVVLPHRRELAPQQYLASLVFFCKVGRLKHLFWRHPSFYPCNIIVLVSCGLFLLCIN